MMFTNTIHHICVVIKGYIYNLYSNELIEHNDDEHISNLIILYTTFV